MGQNLYRRHLPLAQREIPRTEDAKYLGLHFDRRLNWRKQAKIHQAKIIWNSIEQNVLAARQEITTVNRK